MLTIQQVRELAMSLPETTEQDHHGMDSFRVGGKIFATIPDDDHVRAMVDESAILAAVDENPVACEAFYWGKRLACVVVALRAAPPALVKELLIYAWLRKAPKSLVSDFSQLDDQNDLATKSPRAAKRTGQ